ncbi:MAG: hypothetical protein ACI9RO_001983 [Alteromonas macleodii]|jgi:hypothetical protein
MQSRIIQYTFIRLMHLVLLATISRNMVFKLVSSFLLIFGPMMDSNYCCAMVGARGNIGIFFLGLYKPPYFTDLELGIHTFTTLPNTTTFMS